MTTVLDDSLIYFKHSYNIRSWQLYVGFKFIFEMFSALNNSKPSEPPTSMYLQIVFQLADPLASPSFLRTPACPAERQIAGCNDLRS